MCAIWQDEPLEWLLRLVAVGTTTADPLHTAIAHREMWAVVCDINSRHCTTGSVACTNLWNRPEAAMGDTAYTKLCNSKAPDSLTHNSKTIR